MQIHWIIPVLSIALWAVVVVQDLTERAVSVFVLVGLALLALMGRPWHWWLLTAVALLWPWREMAMILPPVALTVGVLSGTESIGPALALSVGVLAWALGWWGAADAVAILALGLRYGQIGLILGAVAAGLASLLLMIARKRSLWSIPNAVPGALSLDVRDEEIPDDSEIPAAAALAVAGIALELGTLLVRLNGGKTMYLGTIVYVLILAAAGIAALVIGINEVKMRRTDPKPAFDDVLRQVAGDEPKTARILDKIYRKVADDNRSGHRILGIAEAYLKAMEEKGVTRMMDGDVSGGKAQ